MKILHILNEVNFSGAEVMLRLAVPFMKSRNIESHILSTGENVGDYATILKEAGYVIHHIAFKKSPKFFLKISKLIQKQDFNVVHLHCERAFFWYAVTGWLSGKVCMIRTVHNVFTYSGLLRITRKTQRKIAKDILGVLFVSIGQSVSGVERNYFNNQTIMIPNWVDDQKFLPLQDKMEKQVLRKKHHLCESDIIITSVGSLTAVKNHRDVITALDKINGKLGNIKYLVLGDGPLKQELQEYTIKLDLTEKVKFFGQAENVRELLVISDIFVMPSLFEGLGNSLLEAMYCGLPSIVYNVYGLRDLVIHCKNGLIVQDNNSKSLAKALKMLAKDEALRTKLGAAARNHAIETHNMEKSLDKLISLYESGSHQKNTVNENWNS